MLFHQSKLRLIKLWQTPWTRGKLGFMPWAAGGHRNVQDILISNVFIVKSIFICKCTQNATFNISHCWIQCVICLLSLKMKLQVYLSTSKSHRREQELPVWLDSEDSSQPSVFPTGVCCLPWDFPKVKALLTVSKATGKSSLAETLNEIYQTNTQKITFIISAFVKTSFPGRRWGQGEQHLQRETISGGMESCAPVLEREKV